MLREIRHVVRAEDGELRRWFTSDYFDLFLFYRDDRLVSFQLCYDKPGYEHALNWTGGRSFRHYRVDTGDATPYRNETPVFGTAATPFPPAVVARFRKEGGAIDAAVREAVLRKLGEYREEAGKRG